VRTAVFQGRQVEEPQQAPAARGLAAQVLAGRFGVLRWSRTVLRSQHDRTPSRSRPPEHCVIQLLERGNSSSRPAVANTSSIGRAIV